jgi:hypothetical protein
MTVYKHQKISGFLINRILVCIFFMIKIDQHEDTDGFGQ